jgi:2-amino-4-hydroxy-6-hydroxymethyldihydropteridine diphosphokinase
VTEVYLGLGSNVGDREAHLAYAIARLEASARVTGRSSVYETAPVGFADQRPFLNMVVRIETGQTPVELLASIRAIEAERGRVRTFRNAPRTLDVDVLLFGDQRLQLETLTVPHPRMNDRPFVLVPLLELAPDLTEPGTGRAYRELLDQAGGPGGVEPLHPTERSK